MSSRRYARRCASGCLLTLVVSGPALAHTPIDGIDNFYNGLLHPVIVPAHLLLLVALGLFFGQQGITRIESALGVFAFATIAGLIAAWFFAGAEVEVLILLLSAATGLLIAINPQVKLLWCMAIGALAGFFLGLDSAQESLSGKEKLVTLFGSGIAIYFLSLYPMALANYFREKKWQKTGIRIVGSWVAASSLLVLALSLSTNA